MNLTLEGQKKVNIPETSLWLQTLWTSSVQNSSFPGPKWCRDAARGMGRGNPIHVVHSSPVDSLSSMVFLEWKTAPDSFPCTLALELRSKSLHSISSSVIVLTPRLEVAHFIGRPLFPGSVLTRRSVLASYPGLLAPVFVACSTNVHTGEGLVKLSHVVWRTWTCGGVAHSFCTAVKRLSESKKRCHDCLMSSAQLFYGPCL